MSDSDLSRTPERKTAPSQDDADSDEDVFHDARFPAEEEAVSSP